MKIHWAARKVASMCSGVILIFMDINWCVIKFSKLINTNYVDGEDVPVPHFGVILKWHEFQELSNSLINKNIDFIIEPSVRFKGKPGEQAIMFFKDPSGNAIEFKSFKDNQEIFKI